MPLTERDEALVTWAKDVSNTIPAASDEAGMTLKQNLYEMALRLEDHAKAADDQLSAAVAATQAPVQLSDASLRLQAVSLADGDVTKAKGILDFIQPPMPSSEKVSK